MSRKEAILVLDGHTNQALACVRSLGRAGYRVLVASYHGSPLGGWSRYCRGHYRLSGQTVPAFAELRGWAARQRVGVVLPLTERTCILCNMERGAWEARGITIGCGRNDMLDRAFDKAQTVRLARACGVAVPSTCVPSSLEECRAAADRVGFPCVIKPRFSNAWTGKAFLPDRGTCYVRGPAELEEAVVARLQGELWPLIQGFVPGEGKGVFALCDRGQPVAWFAHQRLRDVRPTGSGSSLRRSIALDPRLQEPAGRLLRELEWHGPAMVEFRDDGCQPPCLMEVNGRFWTSLQLGVEAGVDFPLLWVRLLRDGSVPPQDRYRVGVTLRWLLGDLKRFLFILAGPPEGFPGRFPTVGQGIREFLGPQPPGTRLEVWTRSDPRPALGELVGGLTEVLGKSLGSVIGQCRQALSRSARKTSA